MSGSDPRSILIVNPFGIGDVLFTTPVIRAVRGAFPDSRVWYLCNRRTEPILRDNPHLAGLIVYERDEHVRAWRRSIGEGLRMQWGLIAQLRRPRFDLMIDLSLGDRYAFAMRLLGVRRAIGFDYRRRGRFLTGAMAIDGFHGAHVVEFQRALLNFMGIRMLESEMELPVSREDLDWADAWLRERGLAGQRPLIGIVPAGGISWGQGAPNRRWSVDGFAAVGDALAERHGARIILLGEAGDRDTCQAVARRMQAGTVDAAGQTSLRQLIGLLKRLDLVVCNDGGPLHIAVSQDVKTVSVFGPVDPAVYGPYPPGESRHRVVSHLELPCRPCYHRFRLPPCPYERACLTHVDPADVITAVDLLLAGTEMQHA